MKQAIEARTRRLIRRAALLVSVAVTGCATYAPSDSMLGMTRGQVIERLGQPDPIPADLANAKRLDFPRGPFGKHTYAVEFDNDGQATQIRQLLTEENFAKIKPGMNRQEVVELIGVAKDSFGLARNRGYVWNYRYITPFCQWFQVEFTLENTVRSTGYGMPPECRRRFMSAR